MIHQIHRQSHKTIHYDSSVCSILGVYPLRVRRYNSSRRASAESLSSSTCSRTRLATAMRSVLGFFASRRPQGVRALVTASLRSINRVALSHMRIRFITIHQLAYLSSLICARALGTRDGDALCARVPRLAPPSGVSALSIPSINRIHLLICWLVTIHQLPAGMRGVATAVGAPNPPASLLRSVSHMNIREGITNRIAYQTMV